jgi:hypothetical protein
MFICYCKIIVERSVYGMFSVLNDFAYNQYFAGFMIFLGCVMFLILEDSLGSLLAYDEEKAGEEEGQDEDGKGGEHADGNSEHGTVLDHRAVFLFGAIDHDMLTCFKLPMTLTCGRRKIHFARLLYYNLHGVLFTLAWCGMDSTLGNEFIPDFSTHCCAAVTLLLFYVLVV